MLLEGYYQLQEAVFMERGYDHARWCWYRVKELERPVVGGFQADAVRNVAGLSVVGGVIHDA